MQWIVEARTSRSHGRVQESKTGRALQKIESALEEPCSVCLLLGGLVGGVNFLSRLVQDGLYVRGIRASRRQVKILLVSLRAIGRQNDPLRLGVDGGLPDQ